jgi:hypothetical protein
MVMLMKVIRSVHSDDDVDDYILIVMTDYQSLPKFDSMV